jgi:hypothetical protein
MKANEIAESSCSISSFREAGLPLPANISNGTSFSSEGNQLLITCKQPQSNCHAPTTLWTFGHASRRLTESSL